MDFFYSRLWRTIRSNRFLYRIIHSTIGAFVDQRHLNKRIKVMKMNGDKVIKDIHALLSSQDIVFFVDFGTLLGFIRNGRLIDWDYDIDFGLCLTDEYSWTELKAAMEGRGYTLVHELQYCGLVTEQTYLCDGVSVDFFCHYSFGDYSEYYVYFRDESREYSDKSFLSTRLTRTVLINACSDYSVENGKVKVPNDYERYLEDVYGSDWRTPIKDFETRFESQSIPPNRTVLPEYGRLVEH